MLFDLNADGVTTGMLAATRLAGFLLFLPVLGMTSLPPPARVLLVLGLAATMMAAPTMHQIAAMSGARIVLAVGLEFLLGTALAFSVHAALAAVSFAGQLLDFQIGFNVAALFDYNTQAQNPLLSTLYSMFGAMAFVAFDAHHALLRSFAATFDVYPPGMAALGITPAVATELFGMVFLYGFALAAPVVLGLFLFDGATAFISRTMPQLNIYFVSLPLKVFWGIVLLTATLTQAGPLLQHLFERAAASLVQES